MQNLLERIIILKTVEILAGIPDAVLAEIAGIVEQVDVDANHQVFAKGDSGNCMYIIVQGRAKAHDNDTIYNYLEERDAFGEMALLAPESRAASVTTVEPCLLFKLDRISFYELMADYPLIAMSIIPVIIGYLRARVQDVMELNKRLKALES